MLGVTLAPENPCNSCLLFLFASLSSTSGSGHGNGDTTVSKSGNRVFYAQVHGITTQER